MKKKNAFEEKLKNAKSLKNKYADKTKKRKYNVSCVNKRKGRALQKKLKRIAFVTNKLANLLKKKKNDELK